MPNCVSIFSFSNCQSDNTFSTYRLSVRAIFYLYSSHRSFLYLPSTFNPRLPLAVLLHTRFALSFRLFSLQSQYDYLILISDGCGNLLPQHKCCGDSNFFSWNATAWRQSDMSVNNSVPDSCCKTVSKFCGKRHHPSNIYHEVRMINTSNTCVH